jgi:hypothetical protein
MDALNLSSGKCGGKGKRAKSKPKGDDKVEVFSLLKD